MSLGKRYRDVVRKQHELSAYVARLLTQFGVGVLIGSIALFIVIGGLGIVLSFKMNEDAMEVMAPVDSVYYQRYEKYKNVFYEDSNNNYQPQWIMSGLGMYLNVVMFPKGGKGRPIGGDSENPEIQGLNAINQFFDLVEAYNSTDGKMFPDLCARHYGYKHADKCYRMNLRKVAEYREGMYDSNLYKRLLEEQRRGTNFLVELPSFKASLDTLTILSTSEILGSSKPDLTEATKCPKKLAGQQGRGVPRYDAMCQSVGDYSENIEALRYGWHLRYETEEDLEQSYNWIMEVETSCKDFEKIVNEKRTENDTYWEFMCYHSTSLSDGAKAGITADMKWIVLALLLSLVFPVVLILKPCGADNFAMMLLIAVGLFFVTLIGTMGVGSMFGFELVYSFLVALLFLAWIFMRLALHMVESLKDYITTVESEAAVHHKSQGSTAPSAFEWMCGHWIFVSVSNFTVLSLTSFLVCCCMYKIVWFTSGFFGVFFIISSLGFILMFLSAFALVMRSRDSDGRPCCMGKDVDSEKSELVLDNGLVAKIKDTYRNKIVEGSAVVKGAISGVFILIFLICLIYSIVIFSADDDNEAYYGYDRTQMMLPEDNGMYMLDVLNKYYPKNGPLVQLIFNNKAIYHFNDNATAAACGGSYCLKHFDVLNKELFPALWESSKNTWTGWLINFYSSFIVALQDDGEKSLINQEAVKKMFSLGLFATAPLNSIYNDLARLHVDDLEPPYAPKMDGDPYTRMFIRQKYLTHTAQEVKFMKELEMAQEKLAKSASPELNKYYPADSFEFYSNLFPMYESSRDIVPRTLLIPAAVVGCIIFTLFAACIALPHPFAHLVVFLNGFMLFFEFFAFQFMLGTTINNFSMSYYFLMFLFAVEYSMYPTHLSLKYILSGGSFRSPSPSPIPALVILVIAVISFLIMLIVPLYSLVAIAIRNCIFAFGVIGPLHELLFVPSLCGLVICKGSNDDKETPKEKIVYDVKMSEVEANGTHKEVEA